ncbi:hypothetical protein [Kaistella sp.]|uniref:hypothetical protein n=1 Tax=Kaistella sp. TaxID=2782235 RepID=UPI003C56A4F2
MKKLVLSTFIASIFLNCEKKNTDISTTDPSTADSITVVPENHEPIEPSTLQTCYMQATNKDSIFISLEDNLGTITGKLRYKNFEKDRSTGDIIGNQNGDTLKLVYTFESEGITSDREIYFLKKEGKLFEAIGEYTNNGSKSSYTNPSKLKYDGHQLTPTDCEIITKNMSSK